MKKIILLLFILIARIAAAQDTSEIFLHSWRHPKKVETLVKRKEVDVYLLKPDSTINKLYPKSYGGQVLGLRSGQLILSISEEELVFKKHNGTKKRSSIYYTFPDSLLKISDGEIRNIDVNTIASISYSKSHPVADVGSFTAGMSVFSALIVAPLVSINYKTGDFRQKRYYNVLGGCAAGLVIGLPLAIIFQKDKTYYLKKNKPVADDDDFYYIDSK